MTGSSATPGADRPAPRRKALLVFGLFLLAMGAVIAYMGWRSHCFEETDNAYLSAPISTIAPRISGVVRKVLVNDNQLVHAGDPLVELDASEQEIKVAQVRAQLLQADEQIRQMEEQLRQRQAEAQAAQALVGRAQAQLQRHASEAERVSALHAGQLKSVSRLELESAVAARDSASAELLAQQYEVQAARARNGSTEAARSALLAQKNVLAAQLRDAELQLGYTRVTAPVSGRIGRKSVEVGERVQAGQQLLAIVQHERWVTANFKETQLPQLRIGQQARVRIDALPGWYLTGRVDSFSPGSGAQFSLLPPDNATGNFTKIVQRIPVKVLLSPREVEIMGARLAPGMSANVEIDLRQKDQAPEPMR